MTHAVPNGLAWRRRTRGVIGVVVVGRESGIGWGWGQDNKADHEKKTLFCGCCCGDHYKNRPLHTRGGVMMGVIGHRLDKSYSQSMHASDIMHVGSLCSRSARPVCVLSAASLLMHAGSFLRHSFLRSPPLFVFALHTHPPLSF